MSHSGRKNHVGREHFQERLECPKINCCEQFPTIDNIGVHLKVYLKKTELNLDYSQKFSNGRREKHLYD